MSRSNYSTSRELPDALYRLIETRALDRTDERISVRLLLESVRASGEYAEKINNSLCPVIARRLIQEHPELADHIETRSLGRRGPNKPKPDERTDLEVVAQHLSGRRSLVIRDLVILHSSGNVTAVDVATMARNLRREEERRRGRQSSFGN